MIHLLVFLFFFQLFASNSAIPEICTLPIETGLCKAYMPSFAYNAIEGTCVRFIYGGCNGNQNRFPTEEECVSKCISSQ